MDKKILLIAPLFFDYYKEIIRELTDLGYEVDYLCDAPSNSNLSKAIGRINKKFIISATTKYFNKTVIPMLSDKQYDYVLVVGGMTFAFTPEMVKRIKKHNRKACFVLYQWDSEKNLPYATGIHKYFDRIYSFDLNDCEASSKYSFLPLFYTRSYEDVKKCKVTDYSYDCMYVGTAHPKKYLSINKMSETLRGKFPNQFIYHYMPSLLKFYYQKMFDKEFRKARLKEFMRKKLDNRELMELFKNSMCVLDAPQAGQTGLTIRTIECLGAGKKLITTNADIISYDFYNEKNILVFDGENVDFDSAFFSSEYEDVDEDIYIKYSLREWLKTMLN